MYNAYETYQQILTNNKLTDCGLRFCLVDENKVPHKQDGSKASPNNINDFVDFYDINIDLLENYKGLGISIQGSNVFAIDVDHCFDIPFDPSSADERAKKVIDLFKDVAYIEFSFSGTGLRVLFKYNEVIYDYNKYYYIKNSKNEIEFYQPSNSFRYVTVTGKNINSNDIKSCPESILYEFLDIYMVRPKRLNLNENFEDCIEERPFEELQKLIATHYRTNIYFQNIWFGKAPGANSDESERDFYLVSYIYSHITKDKNLIIKLIESSPFFKSKDSSHKSKWFYREYRYFNYMFDHVKGQ